MLIVDDDPVSLAFLTAALESARCAATAATTVDAALEIIDATSFDLLLIDLRLPGRDGPTLLHELRTRGVRAPAIAMSADMGSATQSRMLASGFVATLAKPATVAGIQALVASLLGQPAAQGLAPAAGNGANADAAVIDDASALTAIGGDRVALRALRRMLHAELVALESDLQEHGAGQEKIPERLHRLRAACGFCGAPALAAAALRLERAIGSFPTGNAELTDFLSACRATIAALTATDASITAP